MSRTIHKVQVPFTTDEALLIRTGSKPKFLSCQIQNGIPVLWFEVTRGTTPNWDVYFRWVWTGRDIHPDFPHYKATVQHSNLVYHLYFEKDI